MDPKNQFINKIASVVADIPGDALDRGVYTKFAKDRIGGVVAGRSFIATADDIESKIKLAHRIKWAEEMPPKKEEKKDEEKEEKSEGSSEGGEKKEKSEGGGSPASAPQPGMGDGPVETAPPPDTIGAPSGPPAGGASPALEAAAIGGAVEVAKKVMKGGAEQMSMQREMGAM